MMNKELKKFLDKHINIDTDTSKISVFPIPCGVGKSEYIKYLLADALQNNYGLIVVTDSVDRLNNYVTNAQDSGLTEYIQRNSHRLSILTKESIADEIKTINFKPIVLMTTQRYFNLSRDEIINFTSNQKYKRAKIVFDEKIQLLEPKRLTIKNLNDILTALNEGLDNTVNEADKKYLITEYDKINQELQKRLIENEQLNNGLQDFKREIWFDSSALAITDEFNIILKKYKNQLKKYNSDILKDFEAVNKLFFDGIITSQKIKSKKSNQEYKNYYTVVTNNIDKLINIGAKVFVLDGTADISPEYQLKCVNMINCNRFKRDLSKLTINLVNVNTSKDKLTKKDDKTERYIKTIIDYIKSQPINIDTLFTYQSIEKYFENNFEYVNHFGNIKGSNDYRDINNICQVGLNRWSELIYLLYANEIGMYNDSDKTITNRIFEKEVIDDIRCRTILADIEQNLYRCRIRNVHNKEECTYTIICSSTEKSNIFENYQPLIDMLKSRYEKLGAKVNIIDTPIEFKLLKSKTRKTSNETSIQKFDKWLKYQFVGRVFKKSDVKKECNITDSQFKDILHTGILNNFKTDKRGIYKIK